MWNTKFCSWEKNLKPLPVHHTHVHRLVSRHKGFRKPRFGLRVPFERVSGELALHLLHVVDFLLLAGAPEPGANVIRQLLLAESF